MLYSLHTLAAGMSGISALRITEEESETLTKAAYDVMQHYDVELLDEKGMAWLNLATVASGIYGRKIVSAIFEQPKKPVLVSVPKPAPVVVPDFMQNGAATDAQ